jgi:hydroxymethylbilane synthase
MSGVVRIGTRGSKLALVQAQRVRCALLAPYPDLQVTVAAIKTSGDRIIDSPLSRIGGRGLFIREIEEALIHSRLEMAVHSLKDLPTTLPGGLVLAGVLPRENPRDVFISRDGRKLPELTARDRVGTSSLRRKAQLLALNPNLRVVDIRGNLDSRLRKMSRGECEAVVLAACGLVRLGLAGRITEYLEPDRMLPAVCQGILGIETRGEDGGSRAMVSGIGDPLTMQMAEAERTFLRRMGGGCQIPIGCLSSMADDVVTISGLVAELDGRRVVRRMVQGPLSDLQRLAERLADALLAEGGAEILDSIRNRTEYNHGHRRKSDDA